MIRGTPEKLLSQLIDENANADPTYVEDFLLTHRTFMKSSLEVAERLLDWFHEGHLCDRVTRVLLLWVRMRVYFLLAVCKNASDDANSAIFVQLFRDL